jgi:hypothetical protein
MGSPAWRVANQSSAAREAVSYLRAF